MNFIAKYYPLSNGKEKEYQTTVVARDKKEAEVLIRNAYVDRLAAVKRLASLPNTVFIGTDTSNLDEDIRYGKEQMRIVII